MKAWYKENVESVSHFGSKWGDEGFGDATLEEILTRFEERYGQITLDQEKQLISDFKIPTQQHESIEQTFYRMEEKNIMLDQADNGYTGTQIKR